jgi:hypothetical protein
MVIVVSVAAAIFLLLPLITPLALEAFTSIDTIGYQISYAIPIVLRIRQGSRFKRSPFHLGAFSLPVAYASAFYLISTSFIFLWPTRWPMTLDTLNWTCPVLGLACLGGLLYWFTFARRRFHGPKGLRELVCCPGQQGRPPGRVEVATGGVSLSHVS